MGVRLFGSSCSATPDCSDPYVKVVEALRSAMKSEAGKTSAEDIIARMKSVQFDWAPSAKKFTITQILPWGRYVIVEARYEEATNCDGLKVLVYEDVDMEWLRNTKILDPHFCENKNHPSPVARFEPTDHGIYLAMEFCDKMAR